MILYSLYLTSSLILVFMYCRSYFHIKNDVVTFLFESRKSSYIVLNLLIMIIRIKKIFVLKKSSYNHPCSYDDNFRKTFVIPIAKFS